MAGALLGIGQYKGFGLSFMTDVLTGVIAGGAFGLTPYRDPAKLDVSHTFIALDPGWFGPVEAFHARMQAFIGEIKSSELRPGFTEVLVPGELEHRRETEKRAHGVPLPTSDVETLRTLAARLGRRRVRARGAPRMTTVPTPRRRRPLRPLLHLRRAHREAPRAGGRLPRAGHAPLAGPQLRGPRRVAHGDHQPGHRRRRDQTRLLPRRPDPRRGARHVGGGALRHPPAAHRLRPRRGGHASRSISRCST